MFLFRVSSVRGLGHLMRMKWLALSLKERGMGSTFVLDEGSDALLPFVSDVVDHCHFTGCPDNEEQDAARFVEVLAASQDVNSVVLDSYDLGIGWERRIRAEGIWLVVFDDLAREHDCDLLFDQKWLGADTDNRYAAKVPADCRTYLGPAFSLLAPDFRDAAQAAGGLPEEDVPKDVEDKDTKLLFSMGGGGDMELIAGTVKALAETSPESKVAYQVIVGPQARNVEALRQLESQIENLELIEQPNGLARYFKAADLFVGSLGTTLYELVASQTPGITISIADNQANNLTHLADLGHFLHLPALKNEDVPRLASLVKTAITQLPRLKNLLEYAPVKVDGLGAERVADILLGAPSEAAPVSQLLQREALPEPIECFQDGLSIRRVCDADMHCFRAARNRPHNAERMIEREEISPLEHYRWWFNHQRELFVLCKDQAPVLFIWHQMRVQAGKKWLFGGWFTARENVPFSLPMLALKWQLAYTRAEYPDGHWVAVIHRNNKFVNLLNEYMGFYPIREEEPEALARELFPHASPDEFNYVELDFAATTP